MKDCVYNMKLNTYVMIAFTSALITVFMVQTSCWSKMMIGF